MTDAHPLQSLLRIAVVARELNISCSHFYLLTIAGVLTTVRVSGGIRIPGQQPVECPLRGWPE